MYTVVFFVFLVVCIALVVLVLLQHGKGAEVGAAFGSGASQTMFGSRGSASFLTRATAILATLFFVLSLLLAYLSAQNIEQSSVVESGLPSAGAESAPATGNTPADVPMMEEEGVSQ